MRTQALQKILACAAAALLICSACPAVIAYSPGDGAALMRYQNASKGLPVYKSASIWFGDEDNDGNLDLATSPWDTVVTYPTVWRGDGKGSWSDASSGLGGAYEGAVCLGDLNNDSNLDLVAGDYMGKGVSAWVGDGTGSWVRQTTGLPPSLVADGIYISDVNHDDNNDVIFGTGKDYNYESGLGIRVYLGDGHGNWTNSSTGLPVAGSYLGVWTGDVNNDGNQDIVACGGASPADNGVHTFLRNGSGGWGEVSTINTVSQTAGLTLGDFTNDGDLDLAYTGGVKGLPGIYAYKGDGNGNWTNVTHNLPGTHCYYGVWLADMDNDGFSDILAAGDSEAGVKLFRGNGGTQWADISASSGLPTGECWYGVCAGDIDSDGYLDIGVSGLGGVQVWKFSQSTPEFYSLIITCVVIFALFLSSRKTGKMDVFNN